MRTKQGVIDQIFRLLGQPAPQVSTGSTEPHSVFEGIIDLLDLPVDRMLSKPEAGEQIAALAGLPWGADCDSRATPSGGGSTVTLVGLKRLLEAVEVLLGRRAPASKPPPAGASYKQAEGGASAPPTGLSFDVDKFDRSCKEHVDTQNALAELVASCGAEPLSPGPGDPPFDLAWRVGETFAVCEVKSVHEENRRQQTRLGLGQVLEYHTILSVRESGSVRAVLATSRHDALAVRVGASVGVVVTSPEYWDVDLVPLLA